MSDAATEKTTEQLPVKFSKTKAAINKAAAKWKVVPDMTTKKGYEDGQQAKRELTPMRTTIEKEMKLQKEAAQTHINNINEKGNELITMIKAIESPIYEAKKVQDDLVAAKKLEEEQKEDRRIAEIEGLVEDIQNLTEGLLGADLETLEERLATANKTTITDDVYMEFVEPASVALTQAKSSLTQAVQMAKDNDAKQKEMDEQKRKSDLEASVQRIKMAPIDLIGKPTEDMEAALKKLQAIEPSKYGELQSQAITAIVETEEKLVAMIKQQKAMDDLKAAQVKEEPAAVEETPAPVVEGPNEDKMLRAYADALVSVELPDIKDERLCAVARDALLELTEIKAFIYENTQVSE